ARPPQPLPRRTNKPGHANRAPPATIPRSHPTTNRGNLHRRPHRGHPTPGHPDHRTATVGRTSRRQRHPRQHGSNRNRPPHRRARSPPHRDHRHRNNRSTRGNQRPALRRRQGTPPGNPSNRRRPKLGPNHPPSGSAQSNRPIRHGHHIS